MKRFEYKVVRGARWFDLERALNKYGRDGWELVSSHEDGGDYNLSFIIFKRELPAFPRASNT